MITFHPFDAKYKAVSRPIPRELPVISTVFIGIPHFVYKSSVFKKILRRL